jgi:hypothetical protein
MVYHAPNAEPLRNRPTLGPLRVLTSDNCAAQITRLPLTALLWFAVITLVIAHALDFAVQLATHFATAQGYDLTGLPLLVTASDLYFPVAAAIVLLVMVMYVHTILQKWRQRLTPRVVTAANFFQHGSAANPTDVGVVFDQATRAWRAHPPLPFSASHGRAFSHTGASLRAFLWFEATIVYEYFIVNAVRNVLLFCGRPLYPVQASRRELYLGVMNTSLACFIVSDAEDAHCGNMVMHAVHLPHGTRGLIVIDRLVAVLNHATQELEMVTLEFNGAERGAVIYSETWGAREASKNTAQEFDLDVQLHQAGLIVTSAVAFSAHTHVHWWANGTAHVDGKLWAPQRESTELTNCFNVQAIYSSHKFIDVPMDIAGQILIANNSQGLPMHGHAGREDVLVAMRTQSKVHQMQVACRSRVAAHLTKVCEASELPGQLNALNALLAATVLHAADHYYSAKHFPLYGSGSIVAIKHDISGVLRHIYTPVHYVTRRLRVKDWQYRDEICHIIYQECLRIDAHFADTALTIGCAF